MLGPGWQLNLILVAAFSLPAVLSALLGYLVAWKTRINASVIGLFSGSVLPASGVALIWPMTRPDPRSVDGPAYILIGLIIWFLIAFPTSLLASTAGVWLSRRSQTRQ